MLSILVKPTSNGSGRPQRVAKCSARGKVRTVSVDLSKSDDWNMGAAAGTLALALDLPWSDGIVHHVLNDGQHRFMFPV